MFRIIALLLVVPVLASADPPDFKSIEVPVIHRAYLEEDMLLLEDCILLEAASEGRLGIEAVASVINRRANAAGTTLTQQVLRRHQFSAMNRYTSYQQRRQALHERALSIEGKMRPVVHQAILDAMDGKLEHVVPGATHYYAHRILTPDWAAGKTRVRVINRHTFLK